MTAESSGALLRERLTQLAPVVEGSSYYLLRTLERAADSLHEVQKLAEALTTSATSLAENIRAEEVVVARYLDPDDEAIDSIEDGYRALEDRLPQLLLGKSSMDADTRLAGEHSEFLHVAYDRCIAALAALIEASKDLRAAVISHDLAAEPRPSEAFDSADALIESLRKGAQ